MKKIKIRFIKGKKEFTIQRKTWLGWRYISWTIDMGYGSCVYRYSGESKEELLTEVLENYYKVDKRFVQIEEHPTIYVY